MYVCLFNSCVFPAFKRCWSKRQAYTILSLSYALQPQQPGPSYSSIPKYHLYLISPISCYHRTYVHEPECNSRGRVQARPAGLECFEGLKLPL